MTKLVRPSWDQYFMEMAHVAKTRSTCVRGTVGSVIVKDKRMITTGYSETPAGIANCGDGGCKRCAGRQAQTIAAGQDKDKCICVHAEQNAILQSAYHGVSTKGATLYSTVAPCISCAKLIINAGISFVVCDEDHSDEEGKRLFRKVGITLTKMGV